MPFLIHKEPETVQEIEIRIGGHRVRHDYGHPVSIEEARTLALYFVDVFTGHDPSKGARHDG